MNYLHTFENLGISERVARFIASTVAIVVAMESPIVGTIMFAVINILAITLVTTAIIGWDPVKFLSHRNRTVRESYQTPESKHHV